MVQDIEGNMVTEEEGKRERYGFGSRGRSHSQGIHAASKSRKMQKKKKPRPFSGSLQKKYSLTTP